MRARKPIFVSIVSMYIEAREAVHAFELAESIEWNLACSRYKLKELCTLFLVE